MKIRIGDRVEWKRADARFEGIVVEFDNRSVLVVSDRGMGMTVPVRELTVIEKRTVST